MATSRQPPLLLGKFGGFLVWRTWLKKTANYTVLASDNGAMFHTQGASGSVTFTLPALSANYRFGFYCAADQNLTVTAPAAGTLIAFNNVAGTSIALSTAGNRVGGLIEIMSLNDASAWLAITHGPNAVTVT